MGNNKEKLKNIIEWSKRHKIISGVIGLVIIGIISLAFGNNKNNVENNEFNNINIDGSKISESFKGEVLEYIVTMKKTEESIPNEVTVDNANEALERIKYKYENLDTALYESESSNEEEQKIIELADKSDDEMIEAFDNLEKAEDTHEQKYVDKAIENLEKSIHISEIIEGTVQ
ncbi:hypothetical protein KJB99_10220 [Staphylococcus epidermidis]|uniref:hypothetical protein n=1 Tax=Staphylococcus epidermidis TaxID=1282 RepID=UPI000D1C80A9|nr:hypothetical protein [Staphylococcus epidermidis]MCE5030066.1 hypothetical protein [Staphylococcus epidermidis]MCE5032372.1 hypothetical protein [Staphylococcus epidermidis]PTE62094.1 hypothetical protein BUY57_10675 [Staphylococcus epidermidis]